MRSKIISISVYIITQVHHATLDIMKDMSLVDYLHTQR